MNSKTYSKNLFEVNEWWLSLPGKASCLSKFLFLLRQHPLLSKVTCADWSVRLVLVYVHIFRLFHQKVLLPFRSAYPCSQILANYCRLKNPFKTNLGLLSSLITSLWFVVCIHIKNVNRRKLLFFLWDISHLVVDNF